MAYGRGGNSRGGYGGGRGGNRGGGRQQEYDNTNKGAFWEVDERDKKNDKSPDLNGKININGEDFWISGWYQRDGGGQKPVIRFALGDPCNDTRNRRDDYNRGRRRDDDDRRDNRRDDRGSNRDSRDDRDGRRRDDDGRDRSQDRYDNRREREEDDRRRSNDGQRPFDEGRDGYRDRPGPNDRDGGPAPDGMNSYDKELDDPLPF